MLKYYKSTKHCKGQLYDESSVPPPPFQMLKISDHDTNDVAWEVLISRVCTTWLLFIYLFIWNKIDKSMDCITLQFLISWDFELAFIHHINFFMMRRQHCSGSFSHSLQIKIKHFTTMEPKSWDAASSPSQFQGTKYSNPRGLPGATF